MFQPDKGAVTEDEEPADNASQRDLTRRKSFLPVDFETRKALLQHHQHKVISKGFQECHIFPKYNIKVLASARGSEKKKKKKPNREKSERSCQCLYMFLTTQSKNPNLRRRFVATFFLL